MTAMSIIMSIILIITAFIVGCWVGETAVTKRSKTSELANLLNMRLKKIVGKAVEEEVAPVISGPLRVQLEKTRKLIDRILTDTSAE